MADFIAGVLGMFLLIGLLVIAIISLAIFLFVFWILMIIDVTKRRFKEDNEKIAWILVILLANWIGAIIYYFVIKKSNKH